MHSTKVEHRHSEFSIAISAISSTKSNEITEIYFFMMLRNQHCTLLQVVRMLYFWPNYLMFSRLKCDVRICVALIFCIIALLKITCKMAWIFEYLNI